MTDLTASCTVIPRRAVLLGVLPLLIAKPALATSNLSWLLATQTIAGVRPLNMPFLDLVIEALRRVHGADTVTRLHDAILARDAENIAEPFPDALTEAAARHLVEMLYTGEIPAMDGSMAATGYHQALGWQVLHFTKAPSICGPGFGWWSQPPATT